MIHAPDSGSGRERRSAAAGSRGIGIADDELRALEAFRVVDLSAHEVLDAHGVDQELDPVPLDDGITRAALETKDGRIDLYCDGDRLLGFDGPGDDVIVRVGSEARFEAARRPAPEPPVLPESVVEEARTGVDIPFIFEKEGESGFRKREKQVIAELTAGQGLVLATGGGAVLDGETRQNLAGRGFVVYLRASIEHQLRRTGRTDARPLLQGGNPRETLERLFAVRDPLYREVADLILDADGANARGLAQDISRQVDAVPA